MHFKVSSEKNFRIPPEIAKKDKVVAHSIPSV